MVLHQMQEHDLDERDAVDRVAEIKSDGMLIIRRPGRPRSKKKRPAPAKLAVAGTARPCNACKRSDGTHTDGCKSRLGCANCRQVAPEKCGRHGGKSTDQRYKARMAQFASIDRVVAARNAIADEMKRLRVRLAGLEKAYAALVEIA